MKTVFVLFRQDQVNGIFASYEEAKKYQKTQASHAIFKDDKFYIQEHMIRGIK